MIGSARVGEVAHDRVGDDIEGAREGNEEGHHKEKIPVSAFVTFETAKGFETCLKRMGNNPRCCRKSKEENHNHELFGVHPKIKKAPDPS